MPTVSVVLPTYNRSASLRRAVESVLVQTYEDFELVVVDDASTDDTDGVVHGLDDDRIRYRRHDENWGCPAARNTGIEAADGELVAFLDSDDRLHEEFLEVSVDRLSEEPDEVAGTCVAYDVRASDGTIRDVHGSLDGRFTYETFIERFNEGEYVPNGLGGNLIRASVFDEVGYLDEDECAFADDFDFHVRLLETYDMVGIDRPLYEYVRHDEQITAEGETKLRGIEAIIRAYGDRLSAYHWRRYYFYRGRALARAGDTDAAIRDFQRCLEMTDDGQRSDWVIGCHYLLARCGSDVYTRLLPAGRKLYELASGTKWGARRARS